MFVGKILEINLYRVIILLYFIEKCFVLFRQQGCLESTVATDLFYYRTEENLCDCKFGVMSDQFPIFYSGTFLTC